MHQAVTGVRVESRRLVVVDCVRGLAFVSMTLGHASAALGVEPAFALRALVLQGGIVAFSWCAGMAWAARGFPVELAGRGMLLLFGAAVLSTPPWLLVGFAPVNPLLSFVLAFLVVRGGVELGVPIGVLGALGLVQSFLWWPLGLGWPPGLLVAGIALGGLTYPAVAAGELVRAGPVCAVLVSIGRNAYLAWWVHLLLVVGLWMAWSTWGPGSAGVGL